MFLHFFLRKLCLLLTANHVIASPSFSRPRSQLHDVLLHNAKPGSLITGKQLELHGNRQANFLRVCRGGAPSTDPTVLAAVLSMAGGITAGSTAILVFSALPDSSSPAIKSLTSALVVWASMGILESLSAQRGGDSERHAILSCVAQGLGIAGAAGVAFAALWCADLPLSVTEVGAVVGALLEAARHAHCRPPCTVQLAVPYAIALLAVHFQPFLNMRYSAASEFGSKAQVKAAKLALSRTMPLVDLSARWSAITAVLAAALLQSLDRLLSAPPADQARVGAVSLLAKLSVTVNQFWMAVTVAYWTVKEMPYFGLGVVSVAAALLHFLTWRLERKSASVIEGTFAELTGNVHVYEELQNCILVLGAMRMVYWEVSDSEITAPTLCKHFYSLVASFAAFGISSSYSRGPAATVTGIAATFIALLRMVVVYLFSPGASSTVAAGALGLGVGVMAIGGILGGVL